MDKSTGGRCISLRLSCLREMKYRQKGQALGQSFIYQYWYRHRDLRTFLSTATYFLLLPWQARNFFLVSFDFASDLIMTAPESAAASLAVAFGVSCRSQIHALLQDKPNLILCLRQQSCPCRMVLNITTSVMDWEHRKGSLVTQRGNVLPTPSTGHLER